MNNMLFSFEALFSKLAIHQIATSALRKKNFGQENFRNCAICKIHQNFLPPKFFIVGYMN